MYIEWNGPNSQDKCFTTSAKEDGQGGDLKRDGDKRP